MPKIAVIGGGWSGLATATELVAQGFHVTLFEAGRVLGGRARTVSLGGRCFDNGQHILLGAYHSTLMLMSRVGVRPEQVMQRFPLSVFDNTGFSLSLPKIPSPLNLAIGLLTARGVGFSEKIQAALWIQSLKRSGFKLSKDLTVSDWLDQEGQFGKLRGHLWEPLCLAALNTPCDRASARIFANVLRDSVGSPIRSATDILIPIQPLGSLFPEAAHQWLLDHGATVKLSYRVKQLRDRSVDGESFDAAVVAVSPQHASALLPSVPQPINFEPIASIYLEYGVSPSSLLPPLVALHTVFGVIWLVIRPTYDGVGVSVAGVISGRGAWEKLSDGALCQLIELEASRIGPLFVKPEWTKVIREKQATFSCEPGCCRPSIQTPFDGVWQVGDHTWSEYPATLEGAVKSGIYAAQEIAKFVK